MSFNNNIITSFLLYQKYSDIEANIIKLKSIIERTNAYNSLFRIAVA